MPHGTIRVPLLCVTVNVLSITSSQQVCHFANKLSLSRMHNFISCLQLLMVHQESASWHHGRANWYSVSLSKCCMVGLLPWLWTHHVNPSTHHGNHSTHLSLLEPHFSTHSGFVTCVSSVTVMSPSTLIPQHISPYWSHIGVLTQALFQVSSVTMFSRSSHDTLPNNFLKLLLQIRLVTL